MDPVELARHGNLVDHLLNSLVPLPSQHLSSVQSAPSLALPTSTSLMPNVASSTSLMSGDSTASAPPVLPQKSSSFTSIVISVLSNLCRGSAAVTEQVVRCGLEITFCYYHPVVTTLAFLLSPICFISTGNSCFILAASYYIVLLVLISWYQL